MWPALTALGASVPAPWEPVELDLAVNPVPLARARFGTDREGGKRAYLPEQVTDFYEELRWELKAAGVRRPVEGDLRLELRLWRRCRGARGDLSNMVKAFEDGANKVLWLDDRQVVELEAVLVEWGPRVDGRIIARVTPAGGSQA